ncbi:hypothetical protein PLESTF_001627700 [Pleodorina starrii]|nr:hypothetical protein PLESTF_001627700 [Pleodorina starrii]
MGHFSASRVLTWCLPTCHNSGPYNGIANVAPETSVPAQHARQGACAAAVDARPPICKDAGTIPDAVIDTGGAVPAPKEATFTQPLPSFTSVQSRRFMLRSISISGHTRETSFACEAQTDVESSEGARPPAAPGPWSPRSLAAAPRPHRPGVSAPQTPPPLSQAQALGALSCSVPNGPCRSADSARVPASEQPNSHSVVSEPVMLDAANVLDGLTTADLTQDFNAADDAKALLWPEGQVGAGAGADPRSGPGAVSSRDGGLAHHHKQQQPSQRSSRAVQDQPGCAGAAAADGAAAGPPPSSSATQRAVLDLSQVRDCVQDLRVLHIRPGAALLVGKATASGQHVVARFERGRPTSLLSPEHLAALQDGRWRPHEHVVSMLAVHTVVLPAQVLESPPPPPALRRSAAAAVAAGAAPPPLPPCPAVSASGGGGGGGFWEVLDKDLTLAKRALQQAEAVGGLSTSAVSGLIGSGLPSCSNPNAACASGQLLTALGGPPMRLRDVVGHLRTAAAVGSAKAASAPSGGPPPPPPGLAAAAVSAPLVGVADVAFVTLSVTEFCDAGSLSDEARRCTFKCCLPDLPARDGGGGGGGGGVGGGGAAPRISPRCLSDPQLLRRLELFLATARQIALGLQFLHTACRMAHGDLASRNVLLQRRPPGDPRVGSCSDYVAKLAGYGRLAAAAAAPLPLLSSDIDGGAGGLVSATSHLCEAAIAAHAHVSATSLTRVNSVHVGLWRDVHSLAPERLRDPDAPPSFEADVYAYGTILYEMAVGEAPFASMLPACVAVGIATGELRVGWRGPHAAAGAPALPGIARLVEACTSPLPGERPNAAELLAALEGLQEELRAGREAAEALAQQRRSERLVRAFLDSSASSSTSSSAFLSSEGSFFAGGDGDEGGSSGGEGPLLEVFGP